MRTNVLGNRLSLPPPAKRQPCVTQTSGPRNIVPISISSEYHFFTETIYRFSDYTIHIIALSEQITHLTFAADRHLAAIKALKKSDNILPSNRCPAHTSRIRVRLEEYLSGRCRKIELTHAPLFLDRGTTFQQQVWRLLATIPYGETRTYKEVARVLGNPGLARAVGQACHANPLALLIPCHRVVGSGGLGGFAGGTTIKERLLRLEQRQKVR